MLKLALLNNGAFIDGIGMDFDISKFSTANFACSFIAVLKHL